LAFKAEVATIWLSAREEIDSHCFIHGGALIDWLAPITYLKASRKQAITNPFGGCAVLLIGMESDVSRW